MSNCAEVVYVGAAGSERVALSIKKAADAKCILEPTEKVHRFFGFVDHAPANGFVGTWIIGGQKVETQASTVYSEARGVLSTGAFVEVRFTLSGGLLLAQELATIKPPKAGEFGAIGAYRSAAPAVNEPDSTDADQIFYVNGQQYYMADATIVDESTAAVGDGQPVIVNAYQDAGGRLVATKISGISAQFTLFLPSALR